MMQPSTDQSELRIFFLSQLLNKIHQRPLCRLLDTYNIVHDHNGILNTLCWVLKAYIEQLRKGKSHTQNVSRTDSADFVRKSRTRDVWPQIVPQSLKNRISQLFCSEMSSETLQQVTCACCAESCLKSNCEWISTSSLNLDCFRQPDYPLNDVGQHCDGCDSQVEEQNSDEVSDRLSWIAPNVIPPPLPYTAGVLKDILVDPSGVRSMPFDEYAYELNLCDSCLSTLHRQKTPALALANHTFLGQMPPELKDLTPIEESMIALCHAKCWIVQLSEQASDVTFPQNQ